MVSICKIYLAVHKNVPARSLLALPKASMLQIRSCCDEMTLVAIQYRDPHTYAGITAAAVLRQVLCPRSKLTHIFDSSEQV